MYRRPNRNERSEAHSLPLRSARRLRRMALDEARISRAELEALYNSAADVLGETRYELLWCLTQLERACAALERCARAEPLADPLPRRVREEVAEHALQAVRLRQEARLLLCLYKGEAAVRSQSFASRARASVALESAAVG